MEPAALLHRMLTTTSSCVDWIISIWGHYQAEATSSCTSPIRKDNFPKIFRPCLGCMLNEMDDQVMQ